VITAKREKVLNALTKKEFSYLPENMVDPFISFVVAMSTPSEAPRPRDEAEAEEVGPPKPQMPLTPLQKMATGQIERGFKAVIWGDMGMRALIEDDAGKGYIVGVGTPLGGNNGIITDIQNDRLVIQQELWDGNLKQMVPRSVEVKITKAGEQKK
jgi:Tfp pilus assembly protein PilP